jgi:hypothetical protein
MLRILDLVLVALSVPLAGNLTDDPTFSITFLLFIILYFNNNPYA